MRANKGNGRFYFLTGDVNWMEYGAKWIKRNWYDTFTEGHRQGCEYIQLEFSNWEDDTGELYRKDDYIDGKRTTTEHKYVVEVRKFDPCYYTSAQIDNALECHGQSSESLAELSPFHRATLIAECCLSYGYGDVVLTSSSNNAHKLLAQEKRAS